MDSVSKTKVSRTIREYVRPDQVSPFSRWLTGLKDRKAQARIVKSVSKMQNGNLGDCKSVGSGVIEHRIHYGPGYRVYFVTEGEELILLLMGGNKSSQQKDISQAKSYWLDYKQRRKTLCR